MFKKHTHKTEGHHFAFQAGVSGEGVEMTDDKWHSVIGIREIHLQGQEGQRRDKEFEGVPRKTDVKMQNF